MPKRNEIRVRCHRPPFDFGTKPNVEETKCFRGLLTSLIQPKAKLVQIFLDISLGFSNAEAKLFDIIKTYFPS